MTFTSFFFLYSFFSYILTTKKLLKFVQNVVAAYVNVFFVDGSHASNCYFHEMDLLKHHMLGDATLIVARIEHGYATVDD